MKMEINKSLIGGLLFVAVSMIAGFLAYQYILKQQPQPSFQVPDVNPEVGLGMAGALCGGSKRLPCMPGNQCEITNVETHEGVCVHVTDNPGPAMPPDTN